MNSNSQTGNLSFVDMRALPLLLVLVLGVGCKDHPPINYPTIAPFDQSKMQLGPGDKLELTIYYGSKESKATYTLDPSGDIEVRYIGAVKASNKSTKELQKEIQDRLADGYINNPIVSLSVVEINSRMVSVSGQVAHNGSVRFTPGMTITEVVAQSGGFSPLARKNLVKVTRTLDSKQQVWEIPVEQISEGNAPNFPMMPGDKVFVPERPW
jgi:polysaccharide export outer membrane protein